ncbi:MAG: RsmB/NOP family class I SAM-dependent RNA methyltransferase [Candidatus Omnitrophica bacterium]|nr:RsmB/NOP family class I SAM-dependent RNA methyltransferase [Candidatus Omnitrophota bacterium]
MLERFSAKKPLTIRVNTLKASVDDVLGCFDGFGLKYRQVSWYPEALILEDIVPEQLAATALLEQGKIYIQNLASMLVPVILAPQPGDLVLDLCAAPGSKTTQMADMMENKGKIVCVENIRGRFYKLKSVIALLGAGEVCEPCCVDGRRFRSSSGELFDKILVDAPCSSEGRFQLADKKTLAFWSLRKIKEMQKKQKGLLLSASRFLKPGGTLVYSTCTFAPEENESVVDWLLRKTDGVLKVVPWDMEGVSRYPAIQSWNEKVFHPQVQDCGRVLPDGNMDGFFITKLRKE